MNSTFVPTSSHHSPNGHTKFFARLAFAPISRAIWLFVALSLSASVSAASNDCTIESDSCTAVGQLTISIAAGIGYRTNPLIAQSDIPLYVLPKVSFYGKRFFLDNLDAGFTLVETRQHSLHLLLTPGYDRVFFKRNDLQNYFVDAALALNSASPSPTNPASIESARGLQRSRAYTYMAGPEWNWDVAQLSIQLAALYEVTGRHHGAEIRFGIGRTLISSANLQSTISAGATWKSRRTVNYFYGEPQLYTAGSALNPFAKINLAVPLSRHWSLTAFCHYEKLHPAIADSPIVSESHVLTTFAGAAYAF